MANDDSGQSADERVRIRLFDADRTDRLLPVDEGLELRPSERQLLWVDIAGPLDPAVSSRIRDRFELDAATDTTLIAAASGDLADAHPQIGLHGRYVYLRVVAAPDPRDRSERWLDLVSGPNVVISSHAERLELLEAIDDRIAADATIGELDAADFVASVLDAVVTSYRAAVDAIEDELDVIDARALGREHFGELFTRLIDVRHRVGRLRRVLASHRELFAVLARGEFVHAAGAADPANLQAVAARFESTLTAVEESRDLVLGSFEVLMTRTAQRTNDVMRLLTVATVLALPATIAAGFLGMNLETPLPDKAAWPFWLVVGAIVVLDVVIVAIARLRRWI